MKKKSLGRGLTELLGEIEESYDKELTSDSQNYKQIKLSKIKPNPFQPRKKFDKTALQELSESIKKHGQIQPILVSKDGDEYIIIAGERRFRAIKMINSLTIGAVVIDYSIDKLKELSIIENIQREELNPIELASSYQMLIQSHNLTQDELSNKIHKSRTLITNTLRLLKLTPYVQDLIVAETISAGHAKVMVGLDDKTQKIVADTIKGQNLSVRETESLINSLKNKNDKVKQSKTKKFTIDKEEVNSIIGSFEKIGLNAKVNTNKITITLDNVSDTQKFIDLLTKKI
jgi:ParB family chromosome partitioning protein